LEGGGPVMVPAKLPAMNWPTLPNSVMLMPIGELNVEFGDIEGEKKLSKFCTLPTAIPDEVKLRDDVVEELKGILSAFTV